MLPRVSLIEDATLHEIFHGALGSKKVEDPITTSTIAIRAPFTIFLISIPPYD